MPRTSGTWKKGQGGKPKGAISEKTKRWEALGEMIVSEGAKKALDYITSLQGDDFLKHYKDLLEYFKPKLQRTDVTSGDKPLPSPFEGMTFEQLYELKYGRKPDRSGSDKSSGKV
jgi:hypothetical protein